VPSRWRAAGCRVGDQEALERCHDGAGGRIPPVVARPRAVAGPRHRCERRDRGHRGRARGRARCRAREPGRGDGGARATIAGAIAIGGSRYTEDAAEWDARARLLEEERHQLRRSPDQELDELALFYEAKGLAPELARLVAVELTVADALAAHAEEEHGIEVDEPPPPPLVAAVASGLVFVLGALVVVVTAVLTPSDWRVPTTFFAVTIALGLTSVVVARWGEVPLGRTVARNVAIGLTAMAVSFAVGSLIEA
jgi:VIT1/CCC1 family predicted Fe2+/Mn2+ transporter